MDGQLRGHRDSLTVRRVASVAIALVLLAVPIAAQERPTAVTVEGRVLWVAGQEMAVSVPGQSVLVDLRDVPQSGYGALREGDVVRVSGVWTVDNRLVARALEPFPPAPPAR